ncbi:sigma-70 family RNA polymerase sigma factor [Bacillus sp. 1P06AnD]|uniref:sigma-70 family RNA polymerase sigma factor n=1 Tax=Bacillus sp. 1P06AnD TaxID=3132208 RepID=UPI0039A1E49E
MELDEMFRLYVNDIYRYVFSLSKNHHTAEDLVQEAFYKAYVQLESCEIYNMKAWLFKVAYHAFIDFQRKHKRVDIQDSVYSVGKDCNTPESLLMEKENYGRLLSIIHELPVNEKHVLILCDLHSLSNKEAAEVLNMKLNTVKSHLYRGRQRAIKKIKELNHSDEGWTESR